MRGQPGPSLVPGNAPAARRFARARKPPPIILWSIGIITILLILGAAAMLTVGYLNPFGTVGLSILGVGAVVYFGAIIFLVISCLWVERKYPGMQPLSFKFYSRKPQRPTPTAIVNPNISGQIPETTPSYRIHNETPSNVTNVNDVEEITENVPCRPGDSTPHMNDEQNGNDLHEQVSSLDHDNPSAAQQSLQAEGSYDVIKDHVPEVISITDTGNQEEDTSAITSKKSGIKDNSNSQNDKATTNTTLQNEHISRNNQKEYNLAKTYSAQKDANVQQKTRQLEMPVEDYSNPGTSNIKEFGPKTQGIKSQDTTQQSRKSLEINPSHIAVAPSISTYQQEKTIMHQQKETRKDDVPELSSSREQQITEKQSTSVQQTQQNTSQTVVRKDQNAKDISQAENLKRKFGVRARKQITELQGQNVQDISQEKTVGLTSTDSALPADSRKPVLHKTQDIVLQPPIPDKNIDLAVLTKPSHVNERKKVQFQEFHSVQPSGNLVTDNSKMAYVADANHALHHKNDGRHGDQNKSLTNDVSASTKHFAQNPDLQSALPGYARKQLETPKKPNKMESPERARKYDSTDRARKLESPERAMKLESPERGRKLRTDDKLSQSPTNVRKTVSSSSPTRHHQNISPKAQTNKDNSVAMSNLISSKEELYKRLNYHPPSSSQSTDLSSSTSTSPPMHHRKSPDHSPKLQTHASGSTDFYSSVTKEKRHDIPNQQSSPSSFSSDVPSSTSSSPQRHRQKDPDISNKAQRQKDKPTVNSGFPSNTKQDDLNKRLNQQSSQSNDVTSSPTMSPPKNTAK